MAATVDVSFERLDKTYSPGDVVKGHVILRSPSALKHNSIKLVVEGQIGLQLSAKSIGVFEIFHSTLKPINICGQEIEIVPSGKMPAGEKEYTFEFKLAPLAGQELYETYHGVYVNVHYYVHVDVQRGGFSKPLKCTKELIVCETAHETQVEEASKAKPFHFKISPDSIQNVGAASKKRMPSFLFEGFLEKTICDVNTPFTGEISIDKSEVGIKSIELQLVRIESVVYLESDIREATEIQNIQIADGNMIDGLTIPIHMVFPRLFTCTTVKDAKEFKIEFEVNLQILFVDSHLITECFPIKLYRG